jgi:hypothetical protein
MRRAARWDGYAPIKEGGMQPDDCREALAYIKQHRTIDTPFDLVNAPLLPTDPVAAREKLHAYAEAGLTWWLAPLDPWAIMNADWEVGWQPDYAPKMLEWIDRGPVRL